MSTTVSKSPKHEDEMPTKEERDASYSTGAGKKAVEVPKAECGKEANSAGKCSSENEKKLEAPIGLDNETKADDDKKSD
jgi:hypothetical protein